MDIIIKSSCGIINFYAEDRCIYLNDDVESLNCYFQSYLESEGINDLYERDFYILKDGLFSSTRNNNGYKFTLTIKNDNGDDIPVAIIKNIFPLAKISL